MRKPKGGTAPLDDSPQTREAILRWSHSGRRWYSFPNADQLVGALGMCVAVGILMLSQKLLGDDSHWFLIALPLALAVLVVPIWLMWSYLPRRHEKQQRDAVTNALTEKLTAVRFKDGSVSDFAPTGGFLLTYGSGIAFDATHLLGRMIERPGSGSLADIDWIWGLDDFGRFEVRDVPVRGWWERARRRLGRKPRTYLAFSAFGRKADQRTIDWPLAPDYAATGRSLATTLNRKLQDRDAASL